jgi:glycosyltransferase involved in cell wall biosynthesis
MPIFSVVIPTFNHAHYLDRALQSVYSQTLTDWEVIVVDNHSDDETEQVVSRFDDGRLQYLKIHNDGIIAKSRNTGVRAAKGEWIAFLDSDDWWTSEKLEITRDAITESVDFIYHNLEIVHESGAAMLRKGVKSSQVESPVVIDLLLKGNVIPNSSVVVRRHLLNDIGGINESSEMRAAEDYNTWLRIAKVTENFLYLPRRLGFYYIHDKSTSKNNMILPTEAAVAEFLPCLSGPQRVQFEGRLKYFSGRFHYLGGDFSEARKFLFRAFIGGNIKTKIKAGFMLLDIWRRGI